MLNLSKKGNSQARQINMHPGRLPTPPHPRLGLGEPPEAQEAAQETRFWGVGLVWETKGKPPRWPICCLFQSLLLGFGVKCKKKKKTGDPGTHFHFPDSGPKCIRFRNEDALKGVSMNISWPSVATICWLACLLASWCHCHCLLSFSLKGG